MQQKKSKIAPHHVIVMWPLLSDVAKMVIFSVYVVNKAGGLIYQYDNYVPRAEAEKTFSYPLDLVLKHHDEKVVVSFGQRDGIKGNASNIDAD